MATILELINWIEDHPVTGAAVLGGVGIVAVGLWKWIWSRRKPTPYLDEVFYSFGKQYFVVAVQEYLSSDDASGYRQIQHSRPDQWSQLIDIKSHFLGLRHRVVPRDPQAQLVVVIRPTRRSREKLIRFNR